LLNGCSGEVGAVSFPGVSTSNASSASNALLILLCLLNHRVHRRHKPGEHLKELLATHGDHELFALLLVGIDDRFHEFAVRVKPRPPALLAIVPRLIQHVHLVAARERDVMDGEKLAS
jgi:hypothetical protein